MSGAVKDWTIAQVVAWLTDLGLASAYAEQFEADGIDGGDLHDLTDAKQRLSGDEQVSATVKENRRQKRGSR